MVQRKRKPEKREWSVGEFTIVAEHRYDGVMLTIHNGEVQIAWRRVPRVVLWPFAPTFAERIQNACYDLIAAAKQYTKPEIYAEADFELVNCALRTGRSLGERGNDPPLIPRASPPPGE